jgi:pilus assembly protein FimV
LAKAYHEMGDLSGAREILEEVLREGDNEQREAAQNLIVLLG